VGGGYRVIKRGPTKNDSKTHTNNTRSYTTHTRIHTHPIRMLYKPIRYEIDDALRSRALGVLCAAPCCELGEHSESLTVANVVTGVVPSDALTTWLPRWRVPCALQALPDGQTAVLVGDKICYAAPGVRLAPGCPCDVVFTGHYIEDTAASGQACPRVLVFDASGKGAARERYDRLRNELARFLAGELCTVQWAGERAAAERLLEPRGALQVPHAIEDVLCLTADWREAVRPMRVHTAGLGGTHLPV